MGWSRFLDKQVVIPAVDEVLQLVLRVLNIHAFLFELLESLVNVLLGQYLHRFFNLILRHVFDVQDADLPTLVVIYALHLLLGHDHEIVGLTDSSFELGVSAHCDPALFTIVLMHVLDCSRLAVYFPYCAYLAP